MNIVSGKNYLSFQKPDDEKNKKKEREGERGTDLTLCAQRRGDPALHHRLDSGAAAGKPAPEGQAGWALGQVPAEAVVQVAAAAVGVAGHGAGGGGGGWAACQEGAALPSQGAGCVDQVGDVGPGGPGGPGGGAGGDQGGKLCSMRCTTDRERGKREIGREGKRKTRQNINFTK